MRSFGGVWGSLEPKLIQSLREGVTGASLRRDLQAGLTVGVVALPLAMAFAIASGVGPERGLFTAIIAGAVISTLSGSRFQVGGPTGAFVVVVALVLARHGYDGLVLATLLAGLILMVLAVSGLGALIRFIPYPVTTGFTTGIALIILSSQVKDFLGLAIESVPPEFMDKWHSYALALPSINPWALLIGAASLAALLLLRRYRPKWPAALLVTASAAFAAWLWHLPVETIGSRFGAIPAMLPAPHLPDLSLGRIGEILPDAMTIAMLGAIESLLSAVVADGLTGDRHRPSAELLAQGAGNIAAALFGGIPATGAIARTATNIRAGAASPLSGIFHAATLLAIMIAAAPLAGLIPLAALAAVLIQVAINMSEIDKFVALFRAPRSDAAVLLATFLLTVLVDLNVAIQVGFVLAALLFMKRMTQVSSVAPMDWFGHEEMHPGLLAHRMGMPEVEIYEVNGPFFFGVADRFNRLIDGSGRSPAVLVLRLRHVPAIDATGAHALRLLHRRCTRAGTQLVLSGVQPQPQLVLSRSGLGDEIGPENLCNDIGLALARARQLSGQVTHDEKAVTST